MSGGEAADGVAGHALHGRAQRLPHAKLKIARNIVFFDRVSIDVAQQAIACISKIVYVAEPQATCGRRKL